MNKPEHCHFSTHFTNVNQVRFSWSGFQVTIKEARCISTDWTQESTEWTSALTSNIFKYLVKSIGKKHSQLIKLQFFITRAVTAAHWKSQNWQFGTESHWSIHTLIQLLSSKWKDQLLHPNQDPCKEWEFHKYRHSLHWKEVGVVSVCRKKQSHEPSTFKGRVMPRIFK